MGMLTLIGQTSRTQIMSANSERSKSVDSQRNDIWRTSIRSLRAITNAGLIATGLFVAAPIADAALRSKSARAAYQSANPCPSNGHPKGSCPGYVIDHIRPLCAGGEDHPRNMQWQTIAEARAKDRMERQECRMNRGNDLLLKRF